MAKFVDIEFDEEGNSTVAPQGYAGRECAEATKAIERALGMVNAKRRETPDMQKRPNNRMATR